ncbi:MAG: sugar phosphate isomerase/epimerase [Ruminococcaceae bacterium]|nr:sugar phosphate isomerase/epimerase [Oscillospiraceae bacterium]
MMKKLRISSDFNLCYRTTEGISEYIKEGLLFFKENGFDAANFGMGMLDLLSDGWQELVEKAVIDSNEIGVKFEICHLPFLGGGGMKDAEYMSIFDKKMYNSIDAAVLLGAKYAVVHPNAPTVPMIDYDAKAQYDSVMKHLAPYAEYASKVGLDIVIENMRVIHGMRHSHRYCQTPEELCEVADALGIGVCWDFGHANISGVKQSEGLAYVGKRLKVLHVNDNTGIDDDHVAPFMGSVDWRDAMHGLALCEFDGLFNYEIKVHRQPASTRVSFAKYLVDVANELMTYIK